MLPWSLAAVAAWACAHTLAAATAHAPAHPRARVVGITPPPRATDSPQSRRPHHVSSGARTHARPPTDVWPLRVLLVGVAQALAAVAAHAQACAQPLRGGGAAQQRRPARPALQRPRRWDRRGRSLEHPGQMEDGRLPESPSRSTARGRFDGLALPLWRHGALAAVAARCPRDESPRATCSIVPRHGPARGVRCRCHRRHRLRSWPGPSRWALPHGPVLGLGFEPRRH